MRHAALAMLLVPFTTSCVSTAVGVVKAPFQATGKVVDWTTTSQDEADRNYGRKMRKQEAKEGRARRDAAKRCQRKPEDCADYQGYRVGSPQ